MFFSCIIRYIFRTKSLFLHYRTSTKKANGMKRHLFSIILLLGSLRCYSAATLISASYGRRLDLFGNIINGKDKAHAMIPFLVVFAFIAILNIYYLYILAKRHNLSISKLIKKFRIRLCLLAISISVCLSVFYYGYDTPASRLAALFSVLYIISFIAWYTCKLLKATKLDKPLDTFTKFILYIFFDPK